MYGDENPAFTVSADDGLMAFDEALLEVPANTTIQEEPGYDVTTAAGSYPLTAVPGDAWSNYEVTVQSNDTGFTVTPREITMTVQAADKLFGQANPAFGIVLTLDSAIENGGSEEPVVNGDDLSETVVPAAGAADFNTLGEQTPVGVHGMTVSYDTANANYAVTVVDADLTVDFLAVADVPSFSPGTSQAGADIAGANGWFYQNDALVAPGGYYITAWADDAYASVFGNTQTQLTASAAVVPESVLGNAASQSYVLRRISDGAIAEVAAISYLKDSKAPEIVPNGCFAMNADGTGTLIASNATIDAQDQNADGGNGCLIDFTLKHNGQAMVSGPVGTNTSTLAFRFVMAGAYELDLMDTAHNATTVTFSLNDSDGDGLANIFETSWGSDPNSADSDGDGLDDMQEYQKGTNPNNPDTDGDGVGDLEELNSGELKLSPKDPDSDKDGIGDLAVYQLHGAGVNVTDVPLAVTFHSGMDPVSGAVPAVEGLSDAMASIWENLQVKPAEEEEDIGEYDRDVQLTKRDNYYARVLYRKSAGELVALVDGYVVVLRGSGKGQFDKACGVLVDIDNDSPVIFSPSGDGTVLFIAATDESGAVQGDAMLVDLNESRLFYIRNTEGASRLALALDASELAYVKDGRVYRLSLTKLQNNIPVEYSAEDNILQYVRVGEENRLALRIDETSVSLVDGMNVTASAEKPNGVYYLSQPGVEPLVAKKLTGREIRALAVVDDQVIEVKCLGCMFIRNNRSLYLMVDTKQKSVFSASAMK